MMLTGFLRVFTSVLLLLAMTATFVHQAGAATSTSATPTDGSTSATPTDGSTSATPTDGSASTTPTDGSASTTPTDGSTTATDATTDGDASDCPTELAACAADATCQSCVTAASSSAAAVECSEFSLFTSTESGCDVTMQGACCLDDLSEFECMDNAAFDDYFSCFLESTGCSTGFTCDGAEVLDSDASASLGHASAAIAFSCAVMATLPLLWA